MRILFAASECVPFVKTGGLADVIGSLPKELQKNGQTEVRVILPLYDEIDEQYQRELQYLTTFEVQVGWRHQETTIYTLKHDQIIYYFVANDYYFTRKGIYGYYDDGERFIYFSHAVIKALEHIDFKPDILHAHDWQAAMTVALANIMQPVEDMKTVFTIHNLKYQGVMPLGSFDDFFRLPRKHISGMEWNGMLNCLKSALFHADKITTVSPSYAEEIKYPYYGEGLHPMLEQRAGDLVGIINGIDTAEYNPLTDEHIPINYRSSRLKKQDNKLLLQEELGLPEDRNIPLYISVTRLVEQKGMHLLERILEEFLQEDVQFVVLGTGEAEFENYFRYLAHEYPDQVKALITFDEGLARKLYASSDFFVMPSKFEPCGLSQLIALQYLSVPIVRETGGLRDTITPYNEVTGEGNGFSFTNYNAHDLLHVLRYSLEVYHSEEDWKQLLKNVNKSVYRWKDSAKQYKELYESLVPTFIA